MGDGQCCPVGCSEQRVVSGEWRVQEHMLVIWSCQGCTTAKYLLNCLERRSEAGRGLWQTVVVAGRKTLGVACYSHHVIGRRNDSQ
jgi:hypothetical protein